MAELINKETKTFEEVPEEQLQDAILSGKYTFRKGDRLNVIDPETSESYSVPVEKAKKAFQDGFRPETMGEMEERKLKKEFGDSPIRTAVERGIGSATLGASDFIVKNLSPETAFEMGQRERFNPGSAILGEVAGFLTPLGLEAAAAKGVKGTSTLAKMAAKSPVSLAGKLGVGVEEALTKEFVKAASKSGPLGALAKAAPRLTGVAAEAAVLGAGEGLKEYSLGDPNEIGASIILERGLQAALTAPVLVGGIDALLGGAKMVTKPMFQKIDKMMEEKGAKGILQDYAYNKAFDQLKPVKRDLVGLKKWGLTEEEAGKIILDEGILSAQKMSVDDMLLKIQGKMDDYGKQIGKAYDDIDLALSNVGGNPSRSEVFKRITDEVLGPMEKSKLIDENKAAEKVREQMNRFLGHKDAVNATIDSIMDRTMGKSETFRMSNKIVDDTPITFKELWEEGQVLKPLAKYQKGPLGQTDVMAEMKARAYQDIRRKIKDETFDLFEKNKSKFPSNVSEINLRELNKKYHVLSTIEDIASHTVDRYGGRRYFGISDMISGGAIVGSGGNIFLGAVTALGHKYLRENANAMLALGANKLAKMAAIENLQIRSMAKIGKAINGFIAKPSVILSGKAIPMAQRQASYEDQSKKRSLRDRYDKAVKFVSNQNEQTMIDALAGKEQDDANGPGLWNLSPEAMQNLTQSAVQSVNFLKQNIPQDPSALDVFKNAKWEPSKQQMQDFLHLYEGAMNPGKVIEKMGKGEMPVKAFTAMKQLHPVLFQMVQRKMIDEIAKKDGKGVPYDKRVAISMALDAPLEKTMDPRFILAQQRMYAQTGQQPNQMPIQARTAPTQKSRKENLKNTTTYTQSLSKQMTL